MRSICQMVSVVFAVAAIATPAAAQRPVRARSEISIPIKKNTTAAAAPAPANREVPGTKTEVIAPPVIVRLIRNEAGTPVVLAERAPTIGGGPSIPWIPLLGLLGGGVLLHNLDHGSGGRASPTPPDTGTTPPVVPPPPAVVPEPATLVLVATGLVAAFAVRRRSS